MIYSSADILNALGSDAVIRQEARLSIVDGRPGLGYDEYVYIYIDKYPTIDEYEATWKIWVVDGGSSLYDVVITAMKRSLPNVTLNGDHYTTTDFASDKTVVKTEAEIQLEETREERARLQKQFRGISETLQAQASAVRDGIDGRDGRDGADGLPGKDGKDGRDGKDLVATEAELFDLKDVEQGLQMERGQVLTWDGVKWTNLYIPQTMSAGGAAGDGGTGGGTIDELNDIGDVTITDPQSGNVLSYQGGQWVNSAAPPADISSSSIDQLSDVDTSTNPAGNGQALIWDGSNWVPGDVASTALQPGDNVSELVNDAGYITSAEAPVQPGDLFSGSYNDLTDKPFIPSNTSDLTNDSGFITAGDIPAAPVTSVNTQTGAVVLDADDIDDTATAHKFATAAQLSAAESAVQPGDNVSTLVNDAGYITSADIPTDAVTSVAGKTGDVTLVKADITDFSDADYATAAQGTLADSSVQPGDNISSLTNDAGYITAAQVPADAVTSVNGQTGVVVLDKGDVGLGNVDNTSDANKPISNATQAALDLKADLVGGVVPNSQLPAIAVTEYLGAAADEAAMLALTGQKGDWCIRTDLGSTWVITGDNPTQLASWTELAHPADAVTSVNGYVGAVVLSASDVGAATEAQGDKADSAVQPGDNVSVLTNDAGYITSADIPADAVASVNGQTGIVVLDADDIDDTSTTHKFATQAELDKLAGIEAGAQVNTVDSVAGKTGAVTLVKADITDFNDADYATAAQGALADSATQPGDNISTLTNDAGYITDAGVTQIVAGTNVTISPTGGTGSVTINATPGGGASAIGDLTDVTITAAATGEVLRYNGAAWVDAQLDYSDLSGLPTLGTAAATDSGDYATAAQGALADSAIQPGDNVSALTNDAGYITSAEVPDGTLAGLTDTDVTAPTEADLLVYRSGKWTSETPTPTCSYTVSDGGDFDTGTAAETGCDSVGIIEGGITIDEVRLDAENTTFTYTDGNLTSTTGSEVQKSFTYDVDDVLQSVTITSNGTSVTKTFGYDVDGNLVSITVS